MYKTNLSSEEVHFVESLLLIQITLFCVGRNFLVGIDSLNAGETIGLASHIKRSAGICHFAYPACEALALPLAQNKQCRSPRVTDIVEQLYTNHGH